MHVHTVYKQRKLIQYVFHDGVLQTAGGQTYAVCVFHDGVLQTAGGQTQYVCRMLSQPYTRSDCPGRTNGYIL